MISAITAISGPFGLASALIAVADKIGWMADEYTYNRSPDYMRNKLISQFYKAHNRALSKLESEIKTKGSNEEKEYDLELLYKLSREDISESTFPNFQSELDNEHYYLDNIINATEAVQAKYYADERVQKLSNMYTNFFHQELAHYAELSRWYDNVNNRTIRRIIEIIRKEIETSNQFAKNAYENTKAIHSNVMKDGKALRSIKELLDRIMLALMVSLSGTGIVFLVGTITNVKLGNVMIIGIPLSFLVSDLCVCAPRNAKIIELVKRATYHIPAVMIELFVFSTFQALIAGACIFILQSLFMESIKGASLLFWISVLFSGCIVIQFIREFQFIKEYFLNKR